MPEPDPKTEGIGARTRRLFGRGSSADRVAYYSDAVYAIAMTLLVLDLKIPDGATSALQVLQEEWQSYVAFMLSFVIIAYSWMSHHRRFKYVIGYDSGLLVVNLVLLFFVVSLPFPTALVSRFAPETSAVVVYAAAVALLELAELVEWIYLKRRGLLSPEIDSGVFWYVFWDFLPAVVVFGGSVVVAFVAGGSAAMYSWFAMFIIAPVAGVLIGRRIDRARRA
ncbi:MAG TPA: TMEM175 family protein [Microbacteriaceae bacterium]|nr:TMEM175 family protein [Microbacteriaceae bacterium]